MKTHTGIATVTSIISSLASYSFGQPQFRTEQTANTSQLAQITTPDNALEKQLKLELIEYGDSSNELRIVKHQLQSMWEIDFEYTLSRISVLESALSSHTKPPSFERTLWEAQDSVIQIAKKFEPYINSKEINQITDKVNNTKSSEDWNDIRGKLTNLFSKLPYSIFLGRTQNLEQLIERTISNLSNSIESPRVKSAGGRNDIAAETLLRAGPLSTCLFNLSEDAFKLNSKAFVDKLSNDLALLQGRPTCNRYFSEYTLPCVRALSCLALDDKLVLAQGNNTRLLITAYTKERSRAFDVLSNIAQREVEEADIQQLRLIFNSLSNLGLHTQAQTIDENDFSDNAKEHLNIQKLCNTINLYFPEGPANWQTNHEKTKSYDLAKRLSTALAIGAKSPPAFKILTEDLFGESFESKLGLLLK